jgi:hypothetical protein
MPLQTLLGVRTISKSAMAEAPKSSKGLAKYNCRPPVAQKRAIHFRNAGRMQFSAALAEIAHSERGQDRSG